jgi:hypothetical protein
MFWFRVAWCVGACGGEQPTLPDWCHGYPCWERYTVLTLCASWCSTRAGAGSRLACDGMP